MTSKNTFIFIEIKIIYVLKLNMYDIKNNICSINEFNNENFAFLSNYFNKKQKESSVYITNDSFIYDRKI